MKWPLVKAWEEGVQDQCVSKELNALLAGLYVLIDDRGGQILPAGKGFSGKDFKKLTEASCARTARTRPTATATSGVCASGSNRSTKPSKPNPIVFKAYTG